MKIPRRGRGILGSIDDRILCSMIPSEQGPARLAAGAGIALAGRISGRIFGVVGDIVAARILGPAVFGLYSIGWTIFRLLELVAPLGFDLGVLRFGARHLEGDDRALKGILSQSLLAPLGSGLFFGISLFLLAPWMAEQLFNKPELVHIFRTLALGVPFAALLPVIAAGLRLTQVVKTSIIVQDLGQPLLALALLGVFYRLSMRLNGVLLSDILSYIACAGLGMIYLRRLFPAAFDPAVRGLPVGSQIWSFSIVASLVAVLSTLIFWIDRLFVGRLLSAEDTGIYQAASQLSVVFAVVLGSLSRIVIPMFANLIHEGRMVSVQEVFRLSTKWGFYLSVPILLVLSIAARETLSSLYGPVYEGAAPVLMILLIGQLSNLVTGPVGPLLVVAGHQNLVLALSAMALGLNTILLWVLVPRYGLIGAGAATSTALSLFFGAALLAARWKLGVWPYQRGFMKGIAAAIVAGVCLMLASRAMQAWNSMAAVSVQFVLATLTFFAVLLTLGLDGEDAEMLKTTWRRIATRP
jgi:O-antigen/teichoic acid export membrane protein